jgi:hypothetical protein
LAYLIDGGFHILYSTGFIMQDYYTGKLQNAIDNLYKIFNWHDIRDDVILF